MIGPLPSICVCVVSSLGAEFIALMAYHYCAGARKTVLLSPEDGSHDQAVQEDRFRKSLNVIGRVWEPKAGTERFSALSCLP